MTDSDGPECRRCHEFLADDEDDICDECLSNDEEE